MLNTAFGLPIDQQPTSSATEANFRVINRDLFGGKKRLRVDKWLETHINYLCGKSKAMKECENVETIDDEEQKFDPEALEYDTLSENDSSDEDDAQMECDSFSEYEEIESKIEIESKNKKKDD